MNKPKHPMQPLVRPEGGRIRFKQNPIVRLIFDAGVLDHEALAKMNFTCADREQFAQLLGYSVDGFAELGYVRRKVVDLVDSQAEIFEAREKRPEPNAKPPLSLVPEAE